MAERIAVEVAYALPDRQLVIELEVEPGCSALEAARRSGIAERFEELDIESARIGIFGKLLDDPRAHLLEPGDRVEIYRPLLLDPRAARKARAAKKSSS